MNTILVPSELNELSDKVLDFAIDLAQQMQAKEIILLNCIIPAHVQTMTASGAPIDAGGAVAHELNRSMMKKREDLISKQAGHHASDHVKINPVVRFNSDKSDLNDYVEEFNVDLVVSGSRDQFSFLEILFGSPTEKMIRKMDFPMIIIKDEPVKTDIEEIALAVDILKDYTQPGLQEIIEFAGVMKARLQLVHVITDDKNSANDAIEYMQGMAKANKISNYAINVIENHSLEDGLEGFIRKQNPDMVALLNQGKGKLHKLIFGSHTEDVLKEVDKPVFISKMQ